MIRYHNFHSSAAWLQRPEHPLYKEIDWTRVDAGHYVVVDPLDNHALLYLSEKAYQVQVRVSLSQDSPLVKLAGPGDRPLASNSSTTSQSSHEDSSQKLPNFKNVKLWKKFLSWHVSKLSSFAAQTRAKRRGPEVKASVTLSAAVLRTLIPYWGLDLHFRLGGDIEPPRGVVLALRDLANRMVKLLESGGPQYLILYLKNSLFYLNKYCAGSPASDPWSLGTPVALSRSGIPRIIPILFRRGIAQKDLRTIRMMNSLLNSFRAFEGTHEEQDFSSIRGGHPAMDAELLKEFQVFCKEEFWPVFVKSHCSHEQWKFIKEAEKHFLIQPGDPVYIPFKAGPNANPGLMGGALDAVLWSRRKRNYVLEWANLVGDTRTPEVFSEVLRHLEGDLEYYFGGDGMTHQPTLSKIQCLPEPAGKVRTIAIVDYWTQRQMSPVHDWMMKVLSFLPTDGTFDQEGALESFARSYRIKRLPTYSIDLKSATDLIPIELYRAVFNGIWRPETVSLWIDYLTDRWFLVPPKEKLAQAHLRGCSIRYGRGQPMGTLSSWPSMALVHHALEIFAAKKAGKDIQLFMDYRVLGDDNVTMGTDVAESYVKVADGLSVPTSPAKTLDGRLFIFAQQIYLDGENVSPLSLKEELGIVHYNERLEMALRAIRRGWLDDNRSIPRFLRLLLTRKAYISSLREWSVGRLGRKAQSALISAFGIASDSVRTLLGYQGSGIQTFFDSVKNKASALAGDQSRRAETGIRSLKKRDLLSRFERDLCVAVGTSLLKRLETECARLEVAQIRFRGFGECMRDVGLMPLFTDIRRGANPSVPEEPGIPIPGGALSLKQAKNEFLPCVRKHASAPGLYVWFRNQMDIPKDDTGYVTAKHLEAIKALGLKSPPIAFTLKRWHHHNDDLELSEMFEPYVIGAHRAQWAIIRDSYSSLLGYIPETSDDADYEDFESEEDGGMGMTSCEESHYQSPVSGVTVIKPDIVSKIKSTKESAYKILSDLVRDDSIPAPWLLLTELAETLSKVTRVPSFTAMDNFKEVTTRSSDDYRAWVRRGKLLAAVLPNIPMAADFTEPIAAELPRPANADEELAEVLLQLDAKVQAKTNQGLLTG